jgi:glucan-binding YG repeat protein
MKKLIISGLLSCSLLFSGFLGIHKTEAALAGQTATDIALNYVGVPYRYGGTTPSGFDCSGLVNFAYKQAGLALPRTARDLYNSGQAISKSSLKEGDLVFFLPTSTGPSHVGIYLSNNQFIHSATSTGVRVDSLNSNYWSKAYYGAKRIDPANNGGWALKDGTWYYYENGALKTGWLSDGGTWYYLGTNGAMKTGWLLDGGTWYFLANSGAMKTGWVSYWGDWYHLSNSGAMNTGWVLSGGKWYYLNESGAMAKNTTIDGYYVGNDGAWIK